MQLSGYFISVLTKETLETSFCQSTLSKVHDISAQLHLFNCLANYVDQHLIHSRYFERQTKFLLQKKAPLCNRGAFRFIQV